MAGYSTQKTDVDVNIASTGLALETGGNLAAAATALGATTGAAVTTDANGTIQQYLRGLIVKVLLLGLETTQVLIRKALAPSLGTVVYIAVSGTAAASSALAAGTYQLSCDVATWYRVNAAVGGTDAAVETAPAKLLMPGQTVQVAVGTDGCIETITSGGAGVLGYELVS